MRIQKRWDANTNIKRNAMASEFPFIGDDAYVVCAERITAMSAVGASTAGELLGESCVLLHVLCAVLGFVCLSLCCATCSSSCPKQSHCRV